ncbi:hypothetical protein D6764_05140 [Candidatus Woesearchaeota archaeon]|nr:MAG: hypothetical protein D6764_05140 [Candidatus Woesearchaeota archaeon]
MAGATLKKSLEELASESDNTKVFADILSGRNSHFYADRQAELYEYLTKNHLSREELSKTKQLVERFREYNLKREPHRTERYNRIVSEWDAKIENALLIHELLHEKPDLEPYRHELLQGAGREGRNYGMLMQNIASTSQGLEEMIRSFESREEPDEKTGLLRKAKEAVARKSKALAEKYSQVKKGFRNVLEKSKGAGEKAVEALLIAGILGTQTPYLANQHVYASGAGNEKRITAEKTKSAFDKNLLEMLGKNGIRSDGNNLYLTSEDIGIVGDMSGYSFVAKYLLHLLEPDKRYTQKEYYRFGLELAADNGVFSDFKNRPRAEERIDVTEFIRRHYHPAEKQKPEEERTARKDEQAGAQTFKVFRKEHLVSGENKEKAGKRQTKDEFAEHKEIPDIKFGQSGGEVQAGEGIPIPYKSLGKALRYTLNTDNLFTEEMLGTNLMLYLAGVELVKKDDKIVGSTAAHHLHLAVPYLLLGSHHLAAEKGLVKKLPEEYYSFAKAAAFVFYDDLYQHLAQHFGWHPEKDRNGNYVDFSPMHNIDQEMNVVINPEKIVSFRYFLSSLPLWKANDEKGHPWEVDKDVLKAILLELSAERGQGWGVGLSARIADEEAYEGILKGGRLTWDIGARMNIGYSPDNNVNTGRLSTDYVISNIRFTPFAGRKMPDFLKDLFVSFGLVYRDYAERKYEDGAKLELGVGFEKLPF